MLHTIACPACNFVIDVSGLAQRQILTCKRWGKPLAVTVKIVQTPAPADDFGDIGAGAVIHRAKPASRHIITSGAIIAAFAVDVLVATDPW